MSSEKEKYKKLGYVECPAFNYEKIYFNKYGYRHLTTKYGNSRPIPEQRRKFFLLKEAPAILKNNKDFSTHDTVRDAQYWSIKAKKSDKIITIVIRQIRDGTKHFYSIMDKKLPKSAKDP